MDGHFEAELTLPKREWYILAARQFGWSKLVLQCEINISAHLNPVLDFSDTIPHAILRKTIPQMRLPSIPQPRIHSAAELETLVREIGFLPFFSCSVRNFSIEEYTPSRYWFVEGVDCPWEWRMELARRGVVAYGKLFAKKAGLVSREWYLSKFNVNLPPQSFIYISTE